MEFHISVDGITKENAEEVMKTFSDSLVEKGYTVRATEISETTEEEYINTALEGDKIQVERYMEHVVIRK